MDYNFSVQVNFADELEIVHNVCKSAIEDLSGYTGLSLSAVIFHAEAHVCPVRAE